MAGTGGIIQGKNCIFEVDLGDGFKPVVCCKSFSVNIDTELKETTSRGSGVFREYDYKSLGAKANVSGLMKIADSSGDAIFFDLANYQRNFLELNFRAIWKDDAGTITRFRALGIVANTNFNAAAAQLADSTCDIQITGEYFIESDTSIGCQNNITAATLNGINLPPNNVIVVNATTALNVVVTALSNPGNPIYKYDYELNGGGKNSYYHLSGVLPASLPSVPIGAPGVYTLVVTPVCQNGVDGTPFVINITKQSPF